MKMNDLSSSISKATSRGIAAMAIATTLPAARTAYYMLPRRDNTLFGMVAFALWDGFALGLATTMLGLCGDGEFPTQRQKEQALLYFMENAVEEGLTEESVDLFALLATATEEEPVIATLEQMEQISSLLSWAAPRGGEAEKFLCEKFPDCLSLIPVFQRKVSEQEVDKPWDIVRKQMEVINFLNAQVQKLQKA